MATVSLIVPFALLAYWNFNTLAVILRRRRLRNRPFARGQFPRGLLVCHQRCHDATNTDNSTVPDSPSIIPHAMAAVTLNIDSSTPHTSISSSADEGIYIRSILPNKNIIENN